MPNSYIEYTTGGSNINELQQAVFSYSGIEVLSADHIKAFALKSDGNKHQFTISSRNATAKTVTLSELPSSLSPSVSKVRIYRQTSSEALVDFVDGARLTERDLDTAYKQSLLVGQEVQEDATGNNTTLNNVTDLTLGVLTTVTNLTATGTVSIPNSNFAKLFVTNSAPQTLAANTLTDVVLNDEERDNTNSFANNAFTPPANGYYCIQGQVRVTCTDPNDLSLVELLLTKSDSPINGTTQGLSETHAQGGSNTNMTTASVSTFAIDFLTTNQPIKMRVKANCGAGTLNINAQDAAFGVFQLA
mgnify:CR=1 FL=1